MNRDYSTVSPSAKMLLMMKGLTNIPYARETATLISAPGPYDTDISAKELMFLFGVFHFEDRYWSIDQLLRDTGITNILELSSGFSFRGLAMAAQQPVYYIDTDLPELIIQKKELQAELKHPATTGTLETLPLNALDEQQFREWISHFPPGPVAIVNEGLLMYLGMTEKEQLCQIIHRILTERGGYWITADVYIKLDTPEEQRNIYSDEKAAKFFEQHHVRDNMFDSFADAEAFFNRMGFAVDKEAVMEPDKLTILPAIMQRIPAEQLDKMAKMGKIQATWRLRVAE